MLAVYDSMVWFLICAIDFPVLSCVEHSVSVNIANQYRESSYTKPVSQKVTITQLQQRVKSLLISHHLQIDHHLRNILFISGRLTLAHVLGGGRLVNLLAVLLGILCPIFIFWWFLCNQTPTVSWIKDDKHTGLRYCGSLEAMAMPTGSGGIAHALFVSKDRKIPNIRIQTRQLQNLLDKRIIVSLVSWDHQSRYP
ncbi:hypothetical protein JHK87_010196 [Glycine soja]|nr:hypothetical protein JHK87_010196 [Glycine soja]